MSPSTPHTGRPYPVKRLTAAHVLTALLLLILGARAAAAPVVRFAPLPMENAAVVHEQFRGLADYLAAEAGVSIQWLTFQDYGDIITAFRRGDVDLAFLGPLPYVVLEQQQAPTEPLGCFRGEAGSASYTCSLVAWDEEPVTAGSVTDRHIGLTQPLSTCGYLAVREMLADAGRRLDGDGNRFSYAGSHSRAALGVVRGSYDVAGVKTSIAERYRHLGLRTIATSRPYPGFTLVANRDTLSGAVRHRLRRAVLRLDPARNLQTPAGFETWGAPVRNGALPPEQCDYTAVAAALARLPASLPGTGP